MIIIFYLVLNRPVGIRDVQYSPFGGGYSGYTNYDVTLHGIVTSDTSDIKGYGSTSSLRSYIQDEPDHGVNRIQFWWFTWYRASFT